VSLLSICSNHANAPLYYHDHGTNNVTFLAHCDYLPCNCLLPWSMQGIELAVHALAAAGACRVMLPNSYLDWDLHFEPNASPEARAAQLEAFVAKLRAGGVYPKYGLQLLSAHQMGSCRMGSTPR
jgi:choline dehydrogenase-like flavoprotein